MYPLHDYEERKKRCNVFSSLDLFTLQCVVSFFYIMIVLQLVESVFFFLGIAFFFGAIVL